jgi:hypothetical protein
VSVDPVSLAITVALNAASMALTASKKIEGPRLDDLKTSTADYGTPLVQFGGTMRLECPCIYAENIREERHKSKTKGGKYNEYRYFGTWASFIADCPSGPIDSVLQLYLDRHLVMDRTGTGGPITAVPGQFGSGLSEGGNWRIYLGTETQSPDPRLLAKIEEREGPGTCPAYLGIAYMVFEDIPLDPFGNRLPQVSVTATRNPVAAYPYQSHDTVMGQQFVAASGGGWMAVGEGDSPGTIEWWWLPTRTLVGYTTGIAVNEGVANFSMGSDGSLYFVGQYFESNNAHTASYVVAPAGAAVRSFIGGAWFDGPTRVFDTTAGRFVFCGTDHSQVSTGYLDVLTGTFVAGTGNARDFCVDIDEGIWGLFLVASSNVIVIQQLVGGSTAFVINGPVTRTSPGTAGIAFVESANQFAVVADGYFLAIDADTGAIKVQRAVSWDLTNLPEQDPTRSDFQSGFSKVSLVDGTTIETFGPALWVAEDVNSTKFFDPTNDSLVTRPQLVSHLTWRDLDRATGGGFTLDELCTEIAQQCGFRSTEYDFSNLDQNIPGYAWTQGAGKDVVGPLLDLHDSDIRPHGFSQQGLKRGQPFSAGTISTEWMVNENRGEDAASQPLYTIPITAETDLPLRIAATFADPTADYQPNTVHAQRNAASVMTNREQTFDLTTLAESADTIQSLIERALRRYWVGSTKPAFRLSPLEIRLEPADVRPLLLEDGELLRVRSTKVVVRANRIIDTEWELDGETQVNPPSWELDDASPLNQLYNTPGGFTYGRDPDTVPIFVQTKGFIFDTPLLSDSDDQTAPFLYDAAGPYANAGIWPGAIVWTADDLATDTVFSGDWDAFTSSEASTWGNCSSTLPDAATDIMDEGSYLDLVLLGGGSLTSVTNDQLLADQSVNLGLVGDELIQFRDVESLGGGQYRLSGFVRGARNSEYATAGHVAHETFLLISSRTHKRTVGASEIGDTDYYRIATAGLDVDTAPTMTLTFAANAHRPPAPAHLELVRDTGTGDWAISWIRRTRTGGSAVNGQDVPLGETSEAYRVKIMNGAVVVATYDVTTSSKLYTSAEQVTDWGGAQTHLTVEVCQMSPALSLEGFASTASG